MFNSSVLLDLQALICKKPTHFLTAQMALVSTIFQMFIVLGMYKFGLHLKEVVQLIDILFGMYCIYAAQPIVILHPINVNETV